MLVRAIPSSEALASGIGNIQAQTSSSVSQLNITKGDYGDKQDLMQMVLKSAHQLKPDPESATSCTENSCKVTGAEQPKSNVTH